MTLFDRQLLDQRGTSVLTLVEQLVGLNAQTARGPSVGLWTRSCEFDQAELDQLLRSYELVKANLLRGTIHMVTARQYVAWRMALQPVLERIVSQECRGLWDSVDRDELFSEAQELLSQSDGLTRAEIGSALSERFPGVAPRHLGFAVRMLVPVVEVADEKLWAPRRTRYILASSVLHENLWPAEDGLPDLLTNYLERFGPSTTSDVSYFTGLTKLAEAVKQVGEPSGRPSERDVPVAEAAPRESFVLPEYDSIFFAHRHGYLADVRRRLIPNSANLMHGSLFFGEEVVASWQRTSSGDLELTPGTNPLPPAALQEFRRFEAWYHDTAQGRS